MQTPVNTSRYDESKGLRSSTYLPQMSICATKMGTHSNSLAWPLSPAVTPHLDPSSEPHLMQALLNMNLGSCFLATTHNDKLRPEPYLAP